MSKLTALLLALALIAGCHKSVHAQTSVAPAQIPHIQFFSANGTPLAGGKVFTYDAGTTTARATCKTVSSSGVCSAFNTDPIILNAGGFADIWLANQSYKFVVQNSTGVQQWTVDNVAGYLGLLNLANTWTFGQTFSQPITVTPSDNQIVVGAAGSQTIFDAPPASGGGVTLHNQTAQSDTYVYRNSTDILANKTLTSPTLNSPTITTPTMNGIQVCNGPGTYINVNNDNSTGTVQNAIVKLVSTNPATAVKAANSDSSGLVGIVCANGGISGIATIQQTGTIACLFDNATTASDYVQLSSTNAPQCHDVGSAKPSSGQIIGRVLSTNVSGGVYLIDLYSPDTGNVPAFPKVIISVPFGSTAFTTDSGYVMVTPTIDTTYRFSAYVHQGQAGTSCAGATTINLFLTLTDPLASSSINLPMPFSNAAATVASSASLTIATTNGAVGDYKGSVVPTTFRAKAGTSVTVTSTYTLGGSCVVKPGYEVVPSLEQMAAN